MSLFGSLGKTAASKREQFSYKSLVDKDEIGEGGFTVIFTARLSSSDLAKIVVKKLLASDKEARKALVKEAWIINKLRHPNGVEFKGICTDKYALLLEYVHFDFTSLGLKVSTHSLADFSAICEPDWKVCKLHTRDKNFHEFLRA